METHEDLPTINISGIPTLNYRRAGSKILKYQVIADRPEDEYIQKIEIRNSMTLIFSQDIDYGIHQFIINDTSSIEIKNLKMEGSIYCSNSLINLYNCTIYHPPKAVDYIVLCENSSKCDINHCIFRDTDLFGVGVSSSSTCVISNTQIINCHEFAISLTNGSFCNIKNSKIDGSSTDLVGIEYSYLTIVSSELQNGTNSAIFVFDSNFQVIDSVFKNNGKGAFSIRNCMNGHILSCRILDSNDTAILVENGSVVVEDTLIQNCNGNGINAQIRSRATIRNCTLTDAKWPLAAFCDCSTGIISNTMFANSEMSGFIIRGDSSVHATNSIIKNCAETAVRVSDSKSVVFEKCLIHDCRYSGIEVCDKSSCHFDDCIFAGGFNVGINCYSGGNAIISNSIILGPFEKAVWCHHGGYGQFSNLIIDNLQLQLKLSAISSFAGHAKMMRQLDKGQKLLEMVEYKQEQDAKSSSDLIPAGKNKCDPRYFCIETSWLVIATNCYIFGVGNYEMIANARRKKTEEDMKILIPCPCLICGKPAIGIYLSPCGHSLYCKDCWNSLAEKPTKCPICHLNIEKSTQRVNCSSEEELCAICYEKAANAIILPCGHAICKECSNRWFEEATDCPFCREPKVQSRSLVSYG